MPHYFIVKTFADVAAANGLFLIGPAHLLQNHLVFCFLFQQWPLHCG
jgi:hypothetical protein